jgi:peptidoglycan hydrolase-like protein with peptidoglycan-binding domain
LNKPATITLYNITEKSPKIMKDGVECTTCKIISFTNGTLVFTVSGFSTYTVVEGSNTVTNSSSSGGGVSSSQNSSATVSSGSSNVSSGSIAGGTGYVNIKPLSITMNDPMVKTLQQKLNARGYTIASSGPGSKGNETNYFGKATQTSLKQYQCAVMKVCSGVSYGVLDQLTYISLFGINATTTVAPNTQVPVPASAGKYVFNRTLSLGSTGEDVRQLQIFLNNKGYTIASSGPGSKGNESSYFGNATKKALARYQADNKIYPSAGIFGPLTRSFVNK